MPYITSEEVSKKRKAIKALFPDWKFSIVRKHHSKIDVSILEADIDFFKGEEGKKNACVNTFYIKENYVGVVAESLQKIVDILEGDNDIESVDSDYGSIPKFYVDLEIGKWDKPFIFKEKVLVK